MVFWTLEMSSVRLPWSRVFVKVFSVFLDATSAARKPKTRDRTKNNRRPVRALQKNARNTQDPAGRLQEQQTCTKKQHRTQLGSMTALFIASVVCVFRAFKSCIHENMLPLVRRTLWKTHCHQQKTVLKTNPSKLHPKVAFLVCRGTKYPCLPSMEHMFDES